MTLSVRNSLFFLGTLLGIAVLSAFSVAGYSLLFGSLSNVPIELPTSHEVVLLEWSVTEDAVAASIGATGVAGLVAVAAAAASGRIFRRVSSPEIYFVTLFLMTIPFEALRIAPLVFRSLAVPPVYGLAITKLILLTRLMGGFSLFTSGIYNAGADYPRIGTISALLFLMAFVIVYLVPVDAQRLLPTLVYAIGFNDAVSAFLAFLAFGSVANYAIGWSKGFNERGGSVFLSASALAAGWLLLVFVPGLIWGIAATVFLIGGAVLFIVTNRSYYLWY